MHASFPDRLFGVTFVTAILLSASPASATIIERLMETVSDGSSTQASAQPVDATTAAASKAYIADFSGVPVFFDPPRNAIVITDARVDRSEVAPPAANATIPAFIGLASKTDDGPHAATAEPAAMVPQRTASVSASSVEIVAAATVPRAIPEPSGVALLGLGLLGLVAVRRRAATRV